MTTSKKNTLYANYLKRVLDLFIGILVSLIISPILLIAALLIPLESPGPVFFRQVRVGKNLRRIEMLKFRTMTNEYHPVAKKPMIGKVAGVTHVGYWLRRFKIDEFPQMINVLKGDLSLVGPRPSVPEHLEKMTEEEKRRYTVKPGLTGLAQVSGNIHISWKERYKKDLIYIENISFLNDFKILLRTALLIVKGEGHFKDKPLKLKSET